MKQVIIFREDLKIGKGKLAAHSAHASLTGFLLVEKKNKQVTSKWLETGQKKVVLKIKTEEEMIDLYNRIKDKLPCQLISDAGLTQVEPGTIICMVIGPWYEEEIDAFTSNLKLL